MTSSSLRRKQHTCSRPFGSQRAHFSSLLYRLPAHRRHRPHHINVAFALILGLLDDFQQAAKRLRLGPVPLGDNVDDLRAEEHLVLVPGFRVDRLQGPVIKLDLLQVDLGKDVFQPRRPRQVVAPDCTTDAGKELHRGVEDVVGVVWQEATRRTVGQVVFVPLEVASWLFFVTCAVSRYGSFSTLGVKSLLSISANFEATSTGEAFALLSEVLPAPRPG